MTSPETGHKPCAPEASRFSHTLQLDTATFEVAFDEFLSLAEVFSTSTDLVRAQSKVYKIGLDETQTEAMRFDLEPTSPYYVPGMFFIYLPDKEQPVDEAQPQPVSENVRLPDLVVRNFDTPHARIKGQPWELRIFNETEPHYAQFLSDNEYATEDIEGIATTLAASLRRAKTDIDRKANEGSKEESKRILGDYILGKLSDEELQARAEEFTRKHKRAAPRE